MKKPSILVLGLLILILLISISVSSIQDNRIFSGAFNSSSFFIETLSKSHISVLSTSEGDIEESRYSVHFLDSYGRDTRMFYVIPNSAIGEKEGIVYFHFITELPKNTKTIIFRDNLENKQRGLLTISEKSPVIQKFDIKTSNTLDLSWKVLDSDSNNIVLNLYYQDNSEWVPLLYEFPINSKEGKLSLPTIDLTGQKTFKARFSDEAHFTESSPIIVTIRDCSLISADFNCDGIVDTQDFTILKSNFGITGATISQGDANKDGIVDTQDFTILKSNFGKR